jgi:hypothetical protein
MVRAMRPWTPATGGWALLHFPGGWDSWVVQVEVHADAGSTTGALNVPAHATRRRAARLFIVDTGIHGGSGSERVW